MFPVERNFGQSRGRGCRAVRKHRQAEQILADTNMKGVDQLLLKIFPESVHRPTARDIELASTGPSAGLVTATTEAQNWFCLTEERNVFGKNKMRYSGMDGGR